MKTIGFLINPIAGMGGKVGLKGTDGVLEKAKKLGAEPQAEKKSLSMWKQFAKMVQDEGEIPQMKILTCSAPMGKQVIDNLPDVEVEIIEKVPQTTSAKHTQLAVKEFVKKGVDLILFCGGDGTARDIFSIVKDSIPIVGIPSGVKMYSGVFAIHPETAAAILFDYVFGIVNEADTEILDLDEDKYRAGQWSVQLFGTAKTLNEPTFIQAGKMMFEQQHDKELQKQIALYVAFRIKQNPKTIYILGCGSTVNSVGKALNLDTTVLGIDVIQERKILAKDVNESTLKELLDNDYPKKLLLSPIGAQGFILGRGNLQLSPEIIRKIGIDNIVVLSTPSKLMKTPKIRIDTGDQNLDKEIAAKKNIPVITGYSTIRLKEISD